MLIIHVDLPGPALAEIAWPLPDIIAGQGVAIPAGVQFGEGPLPVGADGFADNGLGPVLKVLDDPTKAVATPTAVSMIVLALSQFLTDRAHQPKLLLLLPTSAPPAPTPLRDDLPRGAAGGMRTRSCRLWRRSRPSRHLCRRRSQAFLTRADKHQTDTSLSPMVI